jgi:hypothetical protein
MRESHDEGRASHIDLESCVDGRKAGGEALTGAHTGRVLSRENCDSGTPTPCFEAEGHIDGDVTGESPASPARSKTLKEGLSSRGMCGNSSQQAGSAGPPGPAVPANGNREAPQSSADDGESADRSEKAPALTNRIWVRGRRRGTEEDGPEARSQDGPGRRLGECRAKKTGSAPDVATAGRKIRTYRAGSGWTGRWPGRRRPQG